MKKMFKDFFTILPKVLHLRSIIGYNSLVYALKKTPVIGKVIPDRLYKTTFLKVIYWIFHIIKEVGALFIGKMAGISCVYIAAWVLSSAYKFHDMIPGMSESSIFGMFALFFFILYALIGVLLNTNIFKKTPEKDYLVFMIRMDAKKLNNDGTYRMSVLGMACHTVPCCVHQTFRCGIPLFKIQDAQHKA